jgi:5'-nucleotidase
MGEDVFYSGTVAAAIEGTIIGIPSLAVSVAGHKGLHFQAACRFVVDLIKTIDKSGISAGTLLNVNVPNRPIEEVSGYSVTRLGTRSYSDIITRKQDPRGRTYYWIAGKGPNWTGDEDTDFNTVSRGLISLTPIHLDLTDYRQIETISRLRIGETFPRRS